MPSRRGSCGIQKRLKLAMWHGAAAGVGFELTTGICGCVHIWRVLQLVTDAWRLYCCAGVCLSGNAFLLSAVCF